MSETQENPWRDIKEAPTNGTILEGVSELGIVALFSYEYEPPSGEVTRAWWGGTKSTLREGGTFMYLALPHSGGYSRLSSRTDWRPKVWRYLRIWPCPLATQPQEQER